MKRDPEPDLDAALKGFKRAFFEACEPVLLPVLRFLTFIVGRR